MSLTCIVVDDEYLAINVLKEYIGRTQGLELVATFKNPKLALETLQAQLVDLLFLDIQMPYLTGFDLLKKLENPPMVIFTTARHDYAVQAFELDVLDYLVKPISYDRFEKAVQKAIDYHEFKTTKAQKTPTEKTHLMIRADYRIIKIDFPDIEYIEGLGEYVKIFTSQKMHITLAALKDLLEELPALAFVRIHKSYIVSIQHIQSYNAQSVKLKSQKELPIGRAYKPDFLLKIKAGDRA